jgi:uncharacterized protein YhdP
VVVFRDLKTGRSPLELTALDVQLRRDRDYVVLDGNASLPAELGRRTDFEVRLKGTLDEREHLDARIEIEADSLRLAGLRSFLPAGTAVPLGGGGNVRGVLALQQGRLSRVSLGFELQDVDLQLPTRNVPDIEAVRITKPRLELAPDNKIRYPTVTKEMVQRAAPPLPTHLRYGSLAGEVQLRREGETWTFGVDGLRMQSGTRRTATQARVAGSWSGKPVTQFALDLEIDGLDLAATWPLALAFAPSGFDQFAGLAPRGRVESLRAKVRRERAGLEPAFTVAARLVGLGAAPHGRFPGLSGVSLQLDGTDQRGELRLEGAAVQFDWPRMFREPLALERITAAGGWRRTGAAWNVGAKAV